MSGESAGLFTLAAALAVLATWLVRRGALTVGFMDRPNPIIPQHLRPTAYGGGVAVFLGGAAALVVMKVALPVKLWLPAVLFLALGLYDDAKRLSPAPKFLLQLVVAVIAVELGLAAPLLGHTMLDSGLSALVLLTWINASNFTDVCDGLLSGLAVFGLVGFGLLAAPHSALAWAAAGACLGFLTFNRPPASIFLGDAGSHLVGFLLAALSLEWVASSPPPWLAGAQAVLLAAVPLFELVFLTVVRVIKGLPWWRGSPDHFSLRLQAAGYSRLGTDLWAWGGAGFCLAVALLLPRLPLPGRLAALAFTAALALAAAVWLKRHEVPAKGSTRP